MAKSYTPKRHGRGEWIVCVLGTRDEWKEALGRDYRATRAWLGRYWSAIAAALVFAIAAVTIIQVATIYAPNPHVPFLPAVSAVRG